jgi:hypothetical protein
LDSPHEETGEPMRAVWERAWGENFDDWSTFSCPETCANQVRKRKTRKAIMLVGLILTKTHIYTHGTNSS